MQASTRNGTDAVLSPAEVLAAYLEKSPIVQTAIRDLVNILAKSGLPPAEREWAERSLHDALFRPRTPRSGERERGISAEERRQRVTGLREAQQRMDEEERAFAANLARLLAEKDVSQAELARRIGVGPSAVSMMLSRRCRPQRRTIEKVAEALGVEVQQVWPG